MGISLGVLIYMISISKYFIKFNVIIIDSMKKILFILFKPFNILIKIIKKSFLRPISFIVINIKAFIRKYLNKIKKITKKSKKIKA